MYSFKNDYSEGCHQKILESIIKHNNFQQLGYGEDEFSQKAKEIIKEKIENKNAEIFFVSGGTQANLVVVSALLRPHESVICVNSAHVHVHEAGSIEAVGHKLNVVNSNDGKIRVEQIEEILEEHCIVPHMVKPRMVYISNSTELGTIYQKADLIAISEFCRKKELLLYIDGARIGAALCSCDNDLSMADIAKLTDIFYIGGTKNGALIGEAIVICNNALKEDFAYHLKQKGALIAKSRLFGVQFLELFSNNLYFELATHANKMAMLLADAIKSKGYNFAYKPSTNQIFPILPNVVIDKLVKEFEFYVWEKRDNEKSVVRLVTSWATTEGVIKKFLEALG